MSKGIHHQQSCFHGRGAERIAHQRQRVDAARPLLAGIVGRRLLETSISMVSAAAGACGAGPGFSGSAVIITGTICAEGGADGGGGSSRRSRRQLKTWFASMSYHRATTDTDVPGANDAATISLFSASGHRLRGRLSPLVPMFGFVNTSTPRDASDQRAGSKKIASTPRRSSPEGDHAPEVSREDCFCRRRCEIVYQRGLR